MVENYHGYWQPMDLDGSGRHDCDSNYYLDDARSGGSCGGENEPATYLTSCWWCGDEVWYHTNGYGDHVLFDELGWPWQIHSCWEDHAASSGGSGLPPQGPPPRTSSFGYSFQFLSVPRRVFSGRRQQVTGYLDCSSSGGQRRYGQAFNLSEPYDRRTPIWVTVELNGRERCSVLFPKPVADGLPDGTLVTVEVSTLERPQNSFAIASNIRIHRLGTDQGYVQHEIDRGKWECCFCGQAVGTKAFPHWGFLPDMRVACAPCAHGHGNGNGI
ncbi:hypothetical protein [Deinococcus sp. SL84]|uniref:hypothetical protein n=1 Tax=Deinococcus sp. SL84 TaxID=2994663 RepID=UPI0022736E8C|nr:hypothetical protein [Deinococcus sp. SL84]MCY1704288.1 hypothetical protein [Deinococcus sp. SL84]